MMKYPLMSDNITREDLDLVIEHLKKDNPKLTNGPECRAFEEAWSKWLGVKYSVFVNSGASANLLSMTMLKIDRRSTRLNSSHVSESRMPSSA